VMVIDEGRDVEGLIRGIKMRLGLQEEVKLIFHGDVSFLYNYSKRNEAVCTNSNMCVTYPVFVLSINSHTFCSCRGVRECA